MTDYRIEDLSNPVMEMQEIERKFLVKDNTYKHYSHEHLSIVQGYLNHDPERSVRVRLQGNRGFITVKGETSEDGTTRFEWEKEIPENEARALLKVCRPALIEKMRYLINMDGHTFEVDEFFGVNTGLTIAEIELSSSDEEFMIPDWLGREVTGEKRYYNLKLSREPYCIWGDAGLFPAQ